MSEKNEDKIIYYYEKDKKGLDEYDKMVDNNILNRGFHFKQINKIYAII